MKKILSFVKNNILFVIRYLLIILIIIIIILLASQKTSSKAPFDEVSKAVSSSLDTTNIEKNSERSLKKNFNLNADDFEDVMIYTPVTNMHAEEVVLIKLKDDSQADAVIEAIEKRQAEQYNIFEGYAPAEVALLDNSVIDERGSYILYIVAPNSEEVDKIFRKAL